MSPPSIQDFSCHPTGPRSQLNPMSEDMQQNGPGGRHRNRARGRKAIKRATFPFINSQIIAIADSGDLDLLISTIEGYIPQMNLVNVSTAMHRLAKMTSSNPHLQSALQQHSVMINLTNFARAALRKAEMSTSPPQCQALSNITWSMATIQIVDLDLLQTAARLSYRHIQSFKPFELSAGLWAYAKLDSLSPEACESAGPLFQAAGEYIPAKVDQFSFRCLVMSAWAFATARQHNERFFRGIASQMQSMIHTAQCQELANAAWAFSTAGVREEKLFHELARNAMRLLADFKPQELSNIMWAFAAAGHFREDFFLASAAAVQTLDLQPQQLANMMWALSRIRPRHRVTATTILALLPRCTGSLECFKPQELASVALAVAKCFGNVSVESQDRNNSDPNSASNATSHSQVHEFFMAALPLVASRLRFFSGQSLANIATSYLAMGMGSKTNLYSAIACEVCVRLKSLESGALLLLLRNLPAAPHSACGVAICRLFDEAYRRLDSFTAKELQILGKICASLVGLPPSRVVQPADIAKICMALRKEDAWSSVEGMRVNSSHLQLEGGNIVQQGVDHYYQHAGIATAQAVGIDSSGLARAAAVPMEGDEGADNFPGGRINYSVKRTFVDFDDGRELDDVQVIALTPPLPFIPSDVPPEKLKEYRMNYQKFRAGDAVGARGEISDVAALDLNDGSFECNFLGEDFEEFRGTNLASPTGFTSRLPSGQHLEEVHRHPSSGTPVESVSSRSDYSRPKQIPLWEKDDLPPPLSCVPEYIDIEKLSTFRLDYQKFRAGNAVGAKGEITKTTRADDEIDEADAALVKAYALPPPLDIIPQSVSSRKLAAFRVQYQKFRNGESSGARGEVTKCIIEESLEPDEEHDAVSSQKDESQRSGTVSHSEAAAGSNITISVKNTFFHIEDPNTEVEDDSAVQLPPSLDIIPDCVSPERLDAYRTDYQKFRAGYASGAKGEVSHLAALDLASHDADTT